MSVEKETFGQVFAARLRRIEEDAKLVGISMAEVCREAGVGRSTPGRWARGEVPKTVRVVESLEAVIEKRRCATKKVA